MLVSDGGDRMDPDTARGALEDGAPPARLDLLALPALGQQPGLTLAEGDSDAAAESVPEILLHDFFNSLQTPYRAYEASDSRALERAIEDVNRQEKLPITYDELVPRRELAPWAHALALAAVLLLLAARSLEIRRWA